MWSDKRKEPHKGVPIEGEPFHLQAPAVIRNEVSVGESIINNAVKRH